MKEIERKFLVKNDGFKTGAKRIHARQGYLLCEEKGNARVRIEDRGAFLTIKKYISGISRWEFEYSVPVNDAEVMLNELCGGRIVVKDRYLVKYGGLLWEVDVFSGENAGLIIAEVELGSEDQPVEKPPWAGEEVTCDPRYLNVNLAKHPFSKW
ncbi:MAG: CYTH domain-containing protein [Candidatus Marinimicrobia bacterium]|nr:CYTH domain-containing protein [Candidatus Neomarinimicrobiota bacterium]